ncbi:hypothetical protein ABH20_00925 [Geobacillus sp. T6]|uniref:hypothetical protein n=1 Tax=Geobacillus TaxID=129337 RepID=UPI0005CD1F2D|nr:MULTISPECIES: hypothetical protein [Geobacillus]KLR75287.1 hypothetical protein ABH20_00925 [Geobacillus sp. T6]OQP12834.1 hypothetical protein B1692_10100 [Geobacillus thermoleovorans]QNU22968.1 hypothetical protein IC805_08780 [Geobacillus thermoleovorans]WJQ07633.1 hypothetical protein QT235_02970 [Geobacillus stearothermophilus]
MQQVQQLSIFDFLENEENEQKEGFFFTGGAMYAKVSRDKVKEIPTELGDSILYPGDFVQKLGEKARTSFKMQKGYYLRYCGMYDRALLFSVNDFVSDYYYAFYYIDRNTLLICSNAGAKDIRIEKLVKEQRICRSRRADQYL